MICPKSQSHVVVNLDWNMHSADPVSLALISANILSRLSNKHSQAGLPPATFFCFVRQESLDCLLPCKLSGHVTG